MTLDRLRQRRWLGIGILAAIAVAVVAGGLLLFGPRDEVAPDGPPSAVLEPDLVPLSLDGSIHEADLHHDSRDDAYRIPFGAVPAGTEVALRIRAAAGDLEEATVRVYDLLSQTQLLIPMEPVARDAVSGDHGHDYWEATLPTTAAPTVLYYRFIVRDGAAVRYLEDDDLFDGGPGTVYETSPDHSWQIVTYDPDFVTPEWARGAVVYQIFPDRFANADPTNDPSPDAVPGQAGAERYRYGDVYGNPILPRDWETDLPEGYCRAYQPATQQCDEGPLGRDFYGGDLAGITRHLADLADLGVTVVYLNPIFAAPSNHRYDTSDYYEIDPDLGTLADFDALLAEAERLGLRIVLDGVFNHTSSDSPFFDRAGRFSELGACESPESPWSTWYTLLPGPPAKCHDEQTYDDWWGFDTLPVLTDHPDVFDYFYGPDGVARHWIAAGASGWRLDVMNEISDGFLRGLRKAVKDESPDALILGELWHDASPWLLGTQADTTMNYRFRRAVIGLVNGETDDLDGAIAGLTPSQFASLMERVREDYPPPAWEILHNLVDTHDTTRILWTLTPGLDNREEKEDPDAMAAGKEKLRLVSAVQLTWPGMAGIYYGGEVGLTGHDDPDDRRPYPWGREDTELREWYRTLARARADNEALRTGDLRFLHANDATGTLAYARRTEGQAAVIVLNLGDREADVELDLDGYLPSGTVLTDLVGGPGASVEAGRLSVSVRPMQVMVLVTPEGIDLSPPPAPATLEASAEAGRVTLSWQPVDDATAYLVWRSILPGGGYEVIATTDQTRFDDITARNGTRYHYVVTAMDATSNLSDRSPEATALPEVALTAARLEGTDEVEQQLSAVEPGVPITALVRADGFSEAQGPTVGMLAELGHGPAGSDPADAGWTWTSMSFDADIDGADRLVGTVRPEEPGRWAVALRVSTDGGATWTHAGRQGIGDSPERFMELVAVQGPDTEPPPQPSGLVATSISDTAISLAWAAISAPDLHRYEIWRADGDGVEPVRIGTAVGTAFTDTDIRRGVSYRYSVTAQDTSFNRSERSGDVRTVAESREVAVTLLVTVPDYTPPDETVYIAGDFQGWDPGATPMERLDATTWTITLTFTEGQDPQYKYTRGSWEAVEKDDGCGEIPNRTFTVTHGTDARQELSDQVGKWRDIDQCG
jgi:glycosidase